MFGLFFKIKSFIIVLLYLVNENNNESPLLYI